MANFIKRFELGQGKNTGIPLGEVLKPISNHINGINKGRIYGIGGPEKSGKTTFTDFAFILEPYLHALKNNIKINWIYYSFEIDRISKKFDFATYFLYHDFGIETIQLDKGSTKDGKTTIPLSPGYLKGEVLDDNQNKIRVSEDILSKLKEVYNRRLLPLFGEYNADGVQVRRGLITFFEGRENPTGIYKTLLQIASEEGQLTRNQYKKPIKYIPNDPDAIKIVVIDHIRKVSPERNWNLKQTIDKLSDYLVILRNLLGYTFVPILHTNRQVADIGRLSYMKDELYPTTDQLKDSGNLGEDCDYVFTIFNPNDDKLMLK